MTLPAWVLVLDQGTTSTRAIGFGSDGSRLASHSIASETSHPKLGWVEQDPNKIFQASIACLENVLAELPSAPVGLAITNQRESSVLWDSVTGEALGPAIIWSDTRTSQYCETIKHQANSRVKALTGLEINPYFSASKIRWQAQASQAKLATSKHQAAFGTIDSWLMYKLTGKHQVELTNASRTLLLDIDTGRYSQELIDLFELESVLLPEIKDSDGEFGIATIGKARLPILAVLGDQQASLYGHGCHQPGQAKSTYGTGNFFLSNTGTTLKRSQFGLLSTIAWRVNQTTHYAIEGSAFYAGALMDWLGKDLGMFQSHQELESLVNIDEREPSTWLLPAFSGLGAPWWNTKVKAAIVGMEAGTSRSDILTAGLHAIAHQTDEMLQACDAEFEQSDPLSSTNDRKNKQFCIDGGLANSPSFLQILANITGRQLYVPASKEVTAWGVAKLSFDRLGIEAALSTSSNSSTTNQSLMVEPTWDTTQSKKLQVAWKKQITQLIERSE